MHAIGTVLGTEYMGGLLVKNERLVVGLWPDLVMRDLKSMPLCSSSTLMGASELALRISLVRFTCSSACSTLLSHRLSARASRE